MKISLFRGFLSIVSAKGAIFVISLLVTPLLVRVLGSSNYGDYAFVLSVISVSMIFLNAGINDSVRKFVAENRSYPNWDDHVLGFYSRVGIFLSIIGIVSFALLNLSGMTSRLFGSRFELYFYLLGCLIIGRLFFHITRSALMGKGLEHISEPIGILKQLTFGIIGVSLAFVGYGVAGVLIGHIFGSILATFIGLFFISKKYNANFIFRRTPGDFPRSELLIFNVNSIVLVFLSTSLYNADILLLQPLSGSSETGYYKAALVIAEFLWFVPFALQTALLHSTSEMWANEDISRISSIASRVTRYSIAFTLLLVIGIAALANSFFPLYFGADFTRAVLPFILLLPGAFGFANARPILAIGQGKGDLRPLIIGTGGAAVINIALNVLLIPVYGMVGAAIATSIGYSCMFVFHVIIARQMGYDPFIDLRVTRIGLAGLLSAPIIFGLSAMINSSVISLIVVPPIGFVTYSIFLFKTKAITQNEILPILEYIPTPFDSYFNRVLQSV